MRAVVRAESWPIRGGFRIARGARADAEVLVLELHEADRVGRAECVPYARYGESVSSVKALLEVVCAGLDSAAAREAAYEMPSGAAKNALDCALWDLEAKRVQKEVWTLAGLDTSPAPVATMRTVSVGTIDEMREAAVGHAGASVIKVKVDGGADLERIAAVRRAAPGAELVVDANESWSADQTAAWLPQLPGLGVAVLEQPLPAGRDEELAAIEHSVPICADESFHDRSSFANIERRYDMVNIKLDKSGGLTEALACKELARALGLGVMVGCMVSTSLAVAPALLVAQGVRYVDLDGPFLLEADREGALHDETASLIRPTPSLWGGGG